MKNLFSTYIDDGTVSKLKLVNQTKQSLVNNKEKEWS